MTLATIIALPVVLGLLGVWFVRAGENIQTKTDAQLYARHERWRKHRMKIELGSDSWTAATDELARMEKELRRRGYDLNKLAREKIDAELESRAMDFSRCWRTSR